MPQRKPKDDTIWQLLSRFSRWGSGPDLERAKRLMGHDINKLPRGIVVTGSNGKGTVTYTAAALLKRAGLRVGRYVSPHLFSITERVAIDGTPITADALSTALLRVLHESEPDDLALASRFEVLTAAAVRLFAAQQVDTIVWEAGLGGRFDPTRLVPKHTAVLSSVSLEHTAILGKTLHTIAQEKAAIAKDLERPEYAPLILGQLPPEIIHDIQAQQPVLQPKPIPVRNAHLGHHQRTNARLAATATAVVTGDDIPFVDMADIQIPCRGECIRKATLGTPALWVDVAHHESALNAMRPWLEALPKPLTLIFGISNDRDPTPMLEALPEQASLIISEAPYKAMPVDKIDTRRPVERRACLDDAIARATVLSAPNGSIVVLGGLYLAASVAMLFRTQSIDGLRWD